MKIWSSTRVERKTMIRSRLTVFFENAFWEFDIRATQNVITNLVNINELHEWRQYEKVSNREIGAQDLI